MSFGFFGWLFETLAALSAFFATISLTATILGFAVWIAALIAREAVKKGKSWEQFFWLALFFPLIVFIIVVVISPEDSKLDTKICPKCAELIKSQATICKHCGISLTAK